MFRRAARLAGSVVLAATGAVISEEAQEDSAHSVEAVTVVWVIGDSCDNDDAAVDCDDVGRLIANDPETDAVLGLGDLQYENGSLANFNRWYDPKMGAGKGLKGRTDVPCAGEPRVPDEWSSWLLRLLAGAGW